MAISANWMCLIQQEKINYIHPQPIQLLQRMNASNYQISNFLNTRFSWPFPAFRGYLSCMLLKLQTALLYHFPGVAPGFAHQEGQAPQRRGNNPMSRLRQWVDKENILACLTKKNGNLSFIEEIMEKFGFLWKGNMKRFGFFKENSGSLQQNLSFLWAKSRILSGKLRIVVIT